jgi:hypothetical protein
MSSPQNNPRIKVGLFLARPLPDQIPIGMIYVSTDLPIISVVIGPGTPHTWEDFVAGGLVSGTPDTLAMFTTPNSVGDSAITQQALGDFVVDAGSDPETRSAAVTLSADQPTHVRHVWWPEGETWEGHPTTASEIVSVRVVGGVALDRDGVAVPAPRDGAESRLVPISV